jgi:hypothetical protein
MRVLAAVAAPPVRPVKTLPTKQASRKYYTLHTKPNDVFTTRMDDRLGTAVVSFGIREDAVLIGQMLEKYYETQNEWPDVTEEKLVLPNITRSVPILNHLFLTEWEFDELQMLCVSNFLNIVTVNKIHNKRSGYTFSGDTYKLSASHEFYQARLSLLYDVIGPHDVE